MSIPTNLLQSQLALNKQTIRMLHEAEKAHQEDASNKNYHKLVREDHYRIVASYKKQIAKYALLQKALKQEICEQINEQRFGGMFNFN